MRSVFQNTMAVDVRNSFVHSLGPEVVRLVQERGDNVTVAIESLQVLETLLELTPETHSEC